MDTSTRVTPGQYTLLETGQNPFGQFLHAESMYTPLRYHLFHEQNLNPG